jgi:hypothetical protein
MAIEKTSKIPIFSNFQFLISFFSGEILPIKNVFRKKEKKADRKLSKKVVIIPLKDFTKSGYKPEIKFTNL